MLPGSTCLGKDNFLHIAARSGHRPHLQISCSGWGLLHDHSCGWDCRTAGSMDSWELSWISQSNFLKAQLPLLSPFCIRNPDPRRKDLQKLTEESETKQMITRWHVEIRASSEFRDTSIYIIRILRILVTCVVLLQGFWYIIYVYYDPHDPNDLLPCSKDGHRSLQKDFIHNFRST